MAEHFIFKVGTTRYKVHSADKKQAVLDYCAKITQRTGRTSHKREPNRGLLPVTVYPSDTPSTHKYVHAFWETNRVQCHGAYHSRESIRQSCESFFQPLNERPTTYYCPHTPVCWEEIET
jgi:hypothetical protein